MVSVIRWMVIGAVVLAALISMTGCGEQEYLCEIWVYTAVPPWTYHTSDTYFAKSETNADEFCEDDWSSSYDCRDCTEQ